MDEINEKEQIPHIFYDQLDKSQETSILNSIDNFRLVLVWENNPKINDILAKLARNIKLIISEYSGNPDKRCRDINYWINKKIKEYQAENGKDISSYATIVFNDVKWNTRNNDIVCLKEKEHYPTEHVEIMKKLDDYCEIRDNIRCNVLIDEAQCLKYNKYIMKKKQELTSEMQRICSNNYCKLKVYKIGNNCSFNNVEDTFSVINCEGLYKKEELKKTDVIIKQRSPLEIGSIIHRFRRRKYDLKRNIERVDDDRYSSYHSDTMPADSENERYYIEYARPHN